MCWDKRHLGKMGITYSGQAWEKEEGKNKSLGKNKSISWNESSGNPYSDKVFVNILRIIFFVWLCFFWCFLLIFQCFIENEVRVMLLQRCQSRNYSLLGMKLRSIPHAAYVSLIKTFFFFFPKAVIIKQKQILHGHSSPELSCFLR